MIFFLPVLGLMQPSIRLNLTGPFQTKPGDPSTKLTTLY